MGCRLSDDGLLVLLPLDEGSPPPWHPASAGVVGVYVERELFDQLKAKRYDKPCDLCPQEVVDGCLDVDAVKRDL